MKLRTLVIILKILYLISTAISMIGILFSKFHVIFGILFGILLVLYVFAIIDINRRYKVKEIKGETPEERNQLVDFIFGTSSKHNFNVTYSFFKDLDKKYSAKRLLIILNTELVILDTIMLTIIVKFFEII